jgi:hypothetical protein
MRLISAGSKVRILSGPVFGRVVIESEDRRAVALAKADIRVFGPLHAASYDLASDELLLQLFQGLLGRLDMLAIRIGLDRLFIPFTRAGFIAQIGRNPP